MKKWAVEYRYRALTGKVITISHTAVGEDRQSVINTFLANMLNPENVLGIDAVPYDPERLPYPWCRQPARCMSRGSCPRDPSCGD